MVPPLVAALAHEARRFGAAVVFRECDYGGTEHVDIFDAPAALAIRLWDAGYQASAYRADHWRWCASWIDCERTTDRPGAS